jgi:putative endonuclease
MENKSKHFGNLGEELARNYLVENGHEILETNWRFKRYEVDIISRIGQTIVFVEVKARKSAIFGEPEMFVTLQKQRFLTAAANHYLTTRNIELEARFDVVSVLQLNNSATVKHLESAFGPVSR